MRKRKRSHLQNVVDISLDFVRRESLSCNPDLFPCLKPFPVKAHTPNIDQIQYIGILSTEAFTQAQFTPVDHDSIFTRSNSLSSQYPRELGINSMGL